VGRFYRYDDVLAWQRDNHYPHVVIAGWSAEKLSVEENP
jgi:hypothetical protein